LGFDLLTTDAVKKLGMEETISRVRERVGKAKAYVSFDVDFVDPTFAPGTGTPEVGGFTSLEALGLVRGLSGIDIAGCDIVEVYPQYDGPGQVTALLAATVAFEFLSLLARLREAAGTGGEAVSRSD
jgi:agmatinase